MAQVVSNSLLLIFEILEFLNDFITVTSNQILGSGRQA